MLSTLLHTITSGLSTKVTTAALIVLLLILIALMIVNLLSEPRPSNKPPTSGIEP
jgi:hypothetical protein